MEITRKAILLLITFVLLFEALGNIFYSLIEYSRYLVVEHQISWVVLTVLISLITVLLYILSVKYVLKSSKFLLISIFVFIISSLFIYWTNLWIAKWFGTLTQEVMSEVMVGEQMVTYSNHLFLLLSFLALGITFKMSNAKT